MVVRDSIILVCGGYSYPGLGVVAPTRQTTTETSEKKNIKNMPMPSPMTRVSPFSVSSLAPAADDIYLDLLTPIGRCSKF